VIGFVHPIRGNHLIDTMGIIVMKAECYSIRILTGLCLGLSSFLTGCIPDGGAEGRDYDFIHWVGEPGLRPGQFQKPRSVASDGAHGFFVVDMTGRVQHMTLDGQWIAQWQMPEIELGKPKGMAAGADGGVWVSEPHYSRLNFFDADGELVRQWGQFGKEDRNLTFPRDVVWDGKDAVYLVEYSHFDRVRKFSLDGELLQQWGEYGEEPGQFKRPEGLCWSSSGRLYVADACNHRVQIFDADGGLLKVLGGAGKAPGEMRFPYDVAVDREDRLYVCEYGNSRISVFDSTGELIGMLGVDADPAFDLLNPWSLDFVDSEEALVVADSNHHRILVVDTAKLLNYWKGQG
jgi:sugar lactone lactonase YvrE